MPQINYTTITNDFIKNGFFSEYLPPVFSIHNSFDPCSVTLSSSVDLVLPLSFNMSRFTDDGKRRTIYIPEFGNYIATVKYMKDKNLIQDIINLSRDSNSFSPLIQANGELTRHERLYNFGITINEADQEAFKSTYVPNVVEKICRAKGAKGILSLDVSNFYQSIYTHLIPCIKLGYENAETQYKLQKANNADPSITDDYRVYVMLDEHVRNMNVARTNGLLPGTLISQFLAEGLLSRIDAELVQQNIKFVRYVDDYEIFIYDENNIDKIQNSISKTLGKYFLNLNNEKTKYTPFPYYVIENLEKIYTDYLGTNHTTEDVLKLFNTFFDMEKQGTKGAIRFLIKSLNQSFVSPNDELMFSYLLNVLVNDSRSLVKVCELLIERKNSIHFGESELTLIDELLTKQIENNNQLETIWLLYLRKRLSNRRLCSKTSNMIISGNNDLAKILLLEEYKSSLSNKAVETIINSASSWILCYHLFYRDYITKNEFSAKSHITKNLAFYAKLKRERFSFYK